MRRRGFMYKFGAVRDCVHGGSVRYTLHHLLVEAWSAYEQASSTEKAMVLAFAGEKLVLPAMGPRLAWEKQVPGFPNGHDVCASIGLLFNRTSSLSRSRC